MARGATAVVWGCILIVTHNCMLVQITVDCSTIEYLFLEDQPRISMRLPDSYRRNP